MKNNGISVSSGAVPGPSETAGMGRRLRLRTFFGLIGTSLIVGLVFVAALYHHHKEYLRHQLAFEVALQGQTLRTELERMRNIAAQVTSRSRIREELARYQRHELSPRALAAFTHPKLEDAMRLAPDLLGITRIDSAGVPLVSVGEAIPRSWWPQPVQDQLDHLGTPVRRHNRWFLVVSAPIFTGAGERLGADLLLFDIHHLIGLVDRFAARQALAEAGLFVLKGRQARALYRSGDASLWQPSLPVPGNASGHPRWQQNGERVTLIQPLSMDDWWLAYRADSDAVFSLARNHLLVAVIALLTITGAGSLVTFYNIRPLTGRMTENAHILHRMLQEHQWLLGQSATNEARLQEAQRIAGLGSWELDIRSGKAYWSHQAYRCFGYEPGACEASWDNFLAVVHPEDQQRVMQALESACRGEGDQHEIEHRLCWPDGSERVVRQRAMSVRGAGGKVIRLFGTTLDVTEYRRTRERLAQAEAEWVQALDQFDDAVFLLDSTGRLLRANGAFFRLLDKDAAACLGHHVSEIFDHCDQWRLCTICCPGDAQGGDELFTMEADAPANLLGRPLEVRRKVIRGSHGEAVATLVSLHDLSLARSTEERLRFAASVFENTDEGVVITDARARVVEVNRAFTEITGFTREEVLGRTPRRWRSGRQGPDFYRALWRALKEAGRWRGEIWNRRRNGEIFPTWQSITAVRDDTGRLTHYVSVFTDISQIKHSQEQLHHLAHHDALTDLPNRLLLNERLEQACRHASRHGSQLAVIFLDLDRFKHINDSLGHAVGDALLQQVAGRLLERVREGDVVARIGGDEFVVVLDEVSDAAATARVARKLQTAFDAPFVAREHEIYVTPSLGISLFPRDGSDAPTLLRNADAAMYRAKESGRNSYHFYTRELTRNALKRVTLENDLRLALERDQLVLHYQPQVDLESGRLVGAEALLRWQHPRRGLVSPADFIPVAEESGLIVPMGAWVLRRACRQAQAWLQAGFETGTMAVNVAAAQILRGDLVETVEQALRESGLPPQRLELEVTEGFIMRQAENGIEQLRYLRDLGVTLAIDDFGTGYSSLSYLKDLPIQKLKIDRSFVHGIPGDPSDMAIADAVIALGHSLGLTVIAEGVEHQAQVAYLLSRGCSQAQGYHYGRPLPPEEYERLLTDLPEGDLARA